MKTTANSNVHIDLSQNNSSRRQFLKDYCSGITVAATVAAGFPYIATSHAASDLPIRIGVIGCGGRGTGAALDALQAATEVIYPMDTYHTEDAVEGARAAAQGVQIVALADVFQDRLERCREQLQKVGMPVSKDRCFIGFNAYEKVMELPDVNYVILATPPNFRPAHLRAAVEAGKHTFLEKPVAVDATGVRSVIESGEIARRKGLAIGAGTMRRRENGSCETTRRIQEGMIGDIIACEAILSQGELWSVRRQPSWTEMEDQLRNWLYYTWLSGDFIVEQFVHNLDIINWVLGEHPVRAFAMGGRQVRTDPRFGNIYDHFAVEYQFASGVRCFAMDRQTNGCANRIEEVFLGTKGTARFGLFRGWGINYKNGRRWRFSGPGNNPYHQEHQDLISSIRSGQPINEARQLAESTLTAIMGREATYSGQIIEWEDAMNSTQDLRPPTYEYGPLPIRPVPMPGRYKFH
ncbi:MAG: Gfo/Idh/MocA family oxidoreductase [Phycisphaerales bacterium]|jgi:predicted dehydrogenase